MLMTVTDTTAVFTWETSRPAETSIRYGTEKDQLDQTAKPGAPKRGNDQAPPGASRFQSCELRNLKPGTQYYYVCHIENAAASNQAAGRFTTLAPPPGEELFSFATMTDTHVGQQIVARLSLRGKLISPGIRWPEPHRPFWRLAVGAAIDEINASGAAFTIIKGDLTDGSTANEFPQARQLFDRLTRPYRVVHGNHDAAAPFLRTFGLAKPWYTFDHQNIHFVILDTEPLASDKDPVLDAELDWLARDLRDHADQWTFVLLHRPILPKLERASGEALTEELLQLGSGLLGRIYGSGASHTIDLATGKTPSVSPNAARKLAALLRAHGRIAGVFAGHLHRNYVGHWPEETGNLPYVETASTKEYPCGYAITRVFTGGYMQSYHTPRDPQCLHWSAMTQDAYARIGLRSKAGDLTERNFVVPFDGLRLSPKRPSGDSSRPGRSEENLRQP
ncbi:MAG TPA: metallophosphoesterase family protein [Phycisphaerae bacterium]|nr:metallophosphoesterase family protein [Phycisphaerae bacterium]HRY67629.1 metallophosphoesterase family protein [Phycisphaerae bacterium]HSA25016.1 metallophosphoesterase family protein [Phycisphaerae bacterium]